MIRWTARILPALAAVAATATQAAETQDQLQSQDVGLLILAFLILVPLYIAVRVIPGWIESYHNLTRDAPEALVATTAEAETDG